MTWTFWLNIISMHQSALIRALASLPDQEVTVVAESDLTGDRKAIGWHTPDCRPARVLIEPSEEQVRCLLEGRDAEGTIHLLGGIGRGTLNRRVLSGLRGAEATVGVISETADNHGVPGLLRKAKYTLDRISAGRRLDLVLAMGQLGVQWFESSGYPPSRVFPFAYVTERPEMSSEESIVPSDRGAFRILYLGQIVRRKDGITVIRALAGLDDYDWRLQIVGNGEDLCRWKSLASTSGVADRICFRPAVENDAIGELFQDADLLVLPSKHDGWGAVVNEALMCGVPVVCTGNCGAADLLREQWRGSTFKAGSVKGLRGELRRWIEGGRPSIESRARIKQWSAAIEGPSAALYLVEILKHLKDGGQRPSPPWY